MAIEWIRAPLALRYVALGEYDYPSRIRVCERAHSGLIAARADKLIWGDQEASNKIIPKGFWWAEGQDALEQDWESGDFSTWIEGKTEIRAFGVSFDFIAISELLSADKQALGMRAISVMAEADWISAGDLQRLMYQRVNPERAGLAIIEACKLGQLGGRAMRASGEISELAVARGDGKNTWAAIEWDIPIWFWKGFTDSDKSSHDWQMGKARGRGSSPAGQQVIELQGVHFHRSGLSNLGLAKTPDSDGDTETAKKGRKPTYDWLAATTAIWGLIHRGELIPDSQAEIERALQASLVRGDREPSESTVRPYAKLVWDEYYKA